MDKKNILGLVLIVVFALLIGHWMQGDPAQTAATQQASAPKTTQTTQTTKTTQQVSQDPEQAPTLKYSDLNQLLTSNPQSIKKLTFVNGSDEVLVERNGSATATVHVPQGGEQLLIAKADGAKVPVEAKPSEPNWISGALNILIMVAPLLLFFWLISSMMKQQSGRQIGSSKAKQVTPEEGRKTFKDVAGCDEAKQELMETVDYLRNPGLLAHLGGRAPRGVLLVGPPGNGKTLLAKAVAGEAGVPFFAIPASQFVEMFVGVGAARVRDLFEQGRKNSPCVIFIDEIDAVGRQRGAGMGGGHDEREQTLNQLLVEMDGFTTDTAIILMAATNRPDVLDPALVRPGRFDRQVLVDHADINGREAIFKIHMRNKKVAADVDAKELARLTPGYSGAEIEGTCNEAATVAARRIKDQMAEKLRAAGKFTDETLGYIVNAVIKEAMQPALLAKIGVTTTALCNSVAAEMRKLLKSEQEVSAVQAELKANSAVLDAQLKDVGELVINRADFAEGIDRVQMGVARTSRAKSMSRDDMENTSVHELGHALVNTLLKGGDPVTKITIMPRARALGVTQTLPEGDRFNYTDKQLLTRVIMAMGGRAAQEEVLGQVDTGAQNDFKQACGIVRRMVTEFGMSKLGPIFVSEDNSSPFLGRAMAAPSGVGPELANDIDREVRCITNACHELARKLVREHKDFMLAANKVLLAKETLLGPEWLDLLKEHGIVAHAVEPNVDCKGQLMAAKTPTPVDGGGAAKVEQPCGSCGNHTDGEGNLPVDGDPSPQAVS